MALPKRYNPQTEEPRIEQDWQASGIYHFSPGDPGPVYSVDTPPPTVSGFLHLGHVYSYSQTDFMARFFRMNGYAVYYPMGYDDNGLPTERLVEKRLGITASQVGRSAFIKKCLEISEEAEKEYEALWRRLGLSIDWRYTYRTIDDLSRRTSQLSFLDLYKKGLAYRQHAPTIWCPECHTAIAQAEVNDLQRESAFVTLKFRFENGEILPIATTRPELLSACVAVFVHPEDTRYDAVAGQNVTVPLFGQRVPILRDPGADPEKGTGAVMCCTFGDAADVAWWHTHKLPLVVAIDRDGRMTDRAGEFAGLPVPEARKRVTEKLTEQALVIKHEPVSQTVRVHDKCDTPVEHIVARQWFIKVLDYKADFLRAGAQVRWHPAHMQARYREWVENLNWDWCISRQRYFGIPFPVWYCNGCEEVTVANEQELPVDPTERGPSGPCLHCGGSDFTPEEDVMDTWATSSVSPQIVGRWLSDRTLYDRVFPMTLRPQAHDIIRTWLFYTIVKSHHNFGVLPWKEAALSGWGLAPEGSGKISKSRGGGPVAPMEMIERYSADAVRYWAASNGFGKDSVISEEKIQAGAKLVTKLWNVARFSERFLTAYRPPAALPGFSPADRWILSCTHRLIRRATGMFRNYDYAGAKNETEVFLWRDLADNYLEMAKQRLYGEDEATRAGARYALYTALNAVVKLFAPIMPYVTEEIYRGMFAALEGRPSVHTAPWPAADERFINDEAEQLGEALVEVATAVRRYKTESNIPLGQALPGIQIASGDSGLLDALHGTEPDLISITRALRVEIGRRIDPALETVKAEGAIQVALIKE